MTATTRAATSRSLRAGRRACARLTRMNGTTYYWGALLLPPRQRRDVYAVYALCRLADDIVDVPADSADDGRAVLARAGLADPGSSPAERLAAFARLFFDITYAGRPAPGPLLAVIAASVTRRGIAADCFERFFTAMALDLTTSTWASWPALRDGYMEGSAAVIGEMMLPVLEPTDPVAALAPARSLGLAFQLTNFLRDVGEDLDRGRVYLPADDLARHDADPWQRKVTPAWRAFLAEQVDRNRALYRAAEPGLAVLPPASRRCVGTALRLYEQILDRIEAADYDVFTQRIRVPTPRKAGTALTAAAHSLARPRYPPGNTPGRGGRRSGGDTPNARTHPARSPRRRSGPASGQTGGS